MYAVERLGSYITRGVYTVSGPFHPFGGAVDIIVVEQPDGSFKSSPWYVRFGKFQGVLKAREKVVTISVNGIETNFDMILDPRGEAYFLRELEGEEGDSLSYSSSSGDEMDEQSQKSSRPMKSKSCDYDVSKSSGDQLDASNGKIVARNNSRRSRISGLIFGRRSVEGDGHLKAGDGTDIARISSLERAEIAADLVETFMLDGNGLEEKLVEISEISTNVDEASIQVAHQDDGTKVTCSDSQIKDTFERCPGKNLDEKETSDEMDVVLPGCSASEEENRSHRVESSLICETSKRLYIASGGSEEVHLCAQTFHATAEPVVEDTVNKQAENIGLKRRYIESHDIYPQQTFPSSSSLNGHDEANIEVPVTISPFTEMICVNPALDSVEIEPKAISSMSSSSNSVDQIQDEVNIGNEITRDDSEQLNGDCGLTKTSRSPESESSEEEQFFFSDIDDFEPREAQGESDFPDADDNNNHPSSCAEGTSIIIEPVHMNDESYSPSHKCVQKNGLSDFGNVTENPKLISSPIRIPKHQSVASAEVERLVESLPNLWSNFDNLDEDDLSCSLSHSLDLNSKSLEWNMQQKNEPQSTNADTGNDTPLQAYSKDGDTLHSEDNKDGISNPAVEISLCKHLLYEGMGAEAASQAFAAQKLDIDKFTSIGPAVVKSDKLVVRIGGRYFPWDTAAPIVLGMVAFASENIFEPKGMIPVDQVEKSLVGDPSETIVTTGGSWRLWPFPFRRSRSRKTTPALNDTRSSDAENVSESNAGVDNSRKVLDGRVSKKMIKAVTPTSEQLASLNLREGSNEVTFTFSTSVLGRQKVDARIFLWKWNTRIVISDVDGTITKSDVLGQFMPLVGIDWSQTGVAHLFSAIKDNGYQFLYLSARAIAQAYITRQFLVNFKQDGKALPDGPVVISPDGLFPSLFREVIRRAPHEFKIACLEDIRALFPSDCNPFYAGFGNRDTDEISYLKVGIPKGKIFIINPKGEVAVNRLVDTRSYTSLHALVHGMFPAMTSSEQEDYNSWNFWKLPPPDINM
ncbi:phosphatidate phosphatase PAH2 isoform X1 [Ricinus communis]|uniref:phosphatidate phosphatase PAH2 isoform X1 n=1 Tax=Ricinus communis TaxID=3988 RepID=UPI0007725E32|nr:phosphatidate phosphatase PAH2 isoform X1 [Ricinus communis]XP_048226880.1 phosphatidate phosphatase PAH2 isoform X1 [Ricinus communis]|eukprot:XP_015575333.1 phosphatidate phosphatase PAH2 isoform X1 [Ricinus communis]